MRNSLLALLVFFLLSCNPNKQIRNYDEKLKITVTSSLIEDAVLNIADTLVEVQALMGPGVDPHLYKATQGDLKKLTNADIILYNGLFLEGKMGEMLDRLGQIKPVIPVAEVLGKNQLRASVNYANTPDPHVWFDISRWSKVIENTSRQIQKLDTVNAPIYAVRTEIYLKRLDSLHEAVKIKILEIPESQRVIITAHDAFSYFGEAYNIEVRGLQGISTISEFGLKDVTDLVNFIIERNIKAVFVETSVSQKSIKAVVEGCQKRGHDVKIGGYLFSDAMGEKGTEEGTYIGMVNSNVQTIVNALK